MVGEQWYNHADGHATSDPDVRMALTQALDLEQLASVRDAPGAGQPGHDLRRARARPPARVTRSPAPCRRTDVRRREGAAGDVGWTKKLTFLYSSAGRARRAAAAAELAVAGVEGRRRRRHGQGADETALQGAIFGTGDWDIAWVPLNVNSPDQLVPFLSGPGLADGGTNFAGIDNADYDRGVAQASGDERHRGLRHLARGRVGSWSPPPTSCPSPTTRCTTYGNGAEFDVPGHVHAHQHPDAGEVSP